jgi:hypothetical protein
MNRKELIDEVLKRIPWDVLGAEGWAERIVDEVILPLLDEQQKAFHEDMVATIRNMEKAMAGNPNEGLK